MVDTVEYDNDVVKTTVVVCIQGYDIEVDPNRFSVGDEIRIRDCFQRESDVVDGLTIQTQNKVLLEARLLIAECGKSIIPKVCRGWTEEDVLEKLSIDAIGSLLNFFLRRDWRKVSLELQENRPIPSVTSPISIQVPQSNKRVQTARQRR